MWNNFQTEFTTSIVDEKLVLITITCTTLVLDMKGGGNELPQSLIILMLPAESAHAGCWQSARMPASRISRNSSVQSDELDGNKNLLKIIWSDFFSIKRTLKEKISAKKSISFDLWTHRSIFKKKHLQLIVIIFSYLNSICSGFPSFE